MNDLESAMDSLKTPEPTQRKSWIHALPHQWLHLAAHEGNCDALPSRLTPATGCPKCGSAWLSVEQVAFDSQCHGGRLAEGLGVRPLDVLQRAGVEPPMAVRLACGGDHLVEFDGQMLTVVELPKWDATSILAIGGLLVAAKFTHAASWKEK